jgi:hypothetical protein
VIFDNTQTLWKQKFWSVIFHVSAHWKKGNELRCGVKEYSNFCNDIKLVPCAKTKLDCCFSKLFHNVMIVATALNCIEGGIERLSEN